MRAVFSICGNESQPGLQLIRCRLSLKQGTGNRGMGMGMENGEQGTGNGESLKRGIFKIGNL